MTAQTRHLIYPIFLPRLGCPGNCVYCDQVKISGESVFDLDKAAAGVEDFIRRNPGREKQVAFYGGSFTALDKDFRERILLRIKAVCDELTTFRISTHPLFVGAEILDWCGEMGIRTIELGIQDFSTAVLIQTGRGYGGEEALAAATRVRDAGFELGIQLMPGLPGWSAESLELNRRVLSDLMPRFLRLYPLIVIRGTPLEELWRRGEYVPLSLEEAVSQCADYVAWAENLGIRIIKLGLPSNLSPAEIVAGPWHPAFGELVKSEVWYRKILSQASGGEKVRVGKQEQALLRRYLGDKFSTIAQLIEIF